MTSEPRRARASYTLRFADGTTERSGEAEAVVGPTELEVGPLAVSYLDVDRLEAADYRVDLHLWPDGKLTLGGMGRRHDTFVTELCRARNQARVVGLLAHGITMPRVFQGAWRDSRGTEGAGEIQVYETHVTLVGSNADPLQVPLGTVSAVRTADDPHGVVLDGRDRSVVVLTQLGRARDPCRDAIGGHLDAQARVLRRSTGQDGFADGLGLPRGSVRDFTALLARSTAPARAPCVDALVRAATGDPRLGFVQLLDPEGEALAPPTPLPEPWAAFLLVPIDDLTALEVIAGPAAATYVFRASIDEVNRDLQLLHFRRAPLALTDAPATLTLDNPHRLALRTLAPLTRLRAWTVARLVHTDAWEKALKEVIGSGDDSSGRRPRQPSADSRAVDRDTA